MTLPVIRFVAPAAREYERALTHYRQIRLSLRDRFRDELDRLLSRVQENPLSYPSYNDRFRWAKMRRFPYLVFFHLIGDVEIVVVALAHGRRRPGYWIRRKWKN